MAQDKKKSVAQIAGENEVLGAPDTPNPDFVAEMKAQQDSVNAALRDDVMFQGEQDPTLRGTGQPGELYGTPTTPDPEFVKEMQAQQAQVDSLIQAKRDASMEVAQKFSIFDIAKDLNLHFKPFKKGDK